MSPRVMTSAVAAVLALFAGTFLLFDATTFAYHAPDHSVGLPAGCFTTVEILLGGSRPSALRGIELLAALLLLFGVPAAALRVLLRRIRSRSHGAPTV
jgi:hypothetical protein